jgi:hypothetical protein
VARFAPSRRQVNDAPLLPFFFFLLVLMTGESVSMLPKIGSNADWTTKKLQDEIDKILISKRKKACGRGA